MRKTRLIQLLNSINYIWHEEKLFQSNEKILIAFSGGQDSSCLLFFCFLFKYQWQFEMVIIHCNHLWHKATFYNYLELSKISFLFQIHFSFFPTLIPVISEQAARKWRLKCYSRLLNFLIFKVIITGHTKSDQIETFLFNLTRGMGSKNLSSLKEKKKILLNLENFDNSHLNLRIFKKLKNKNTLSKRFFKRNPFSQKTYKKFEKRKNKNFKKSDFLKKTEWLLNKQGLHQSFIIRPLLKQSRFDIQKICNQYKLPLLPDQSNQKILYKRNRIRRQFLPSLRFFLNPQIDLTLCKYNQIINSEHEIIQNFVIKIYDEIFTENEKLYCLNLSIFFSLPLGIQRKICFLFFEKRKLVNLNFSTINLFVSFLKEKYFEVKRIKFKNISKNYKNWIFFPKIGFFFVYKNSIIFLK